MSATELAPIANRIGPLLNAIKRGDHLRTRCLIEDDPSLVEARAPDGASGILLAVYYGHPEMVPLFLEYGARLDFFEACAVGDESQALTFAGADQSLLQKFSADGYHGLGLAVFFGHQKLAEELLARGADVNLASTNPQQVAALHSAVARSNVPMVRMLLDKGARADAVQAGGFTALEAAAFHGNREIVEMLLAHGADPRHRTADGKTAADLASERGHEDLAAHLRR